MPTHHRNKKLGKTIDKTTGVSLACRNFYRVNSTYGAPQIGGGLATILSSVELPTAVLMSWVILSETVLLLQWIGIFIILLGIFVARIPMRKRTTVSTLD